jgi:hypothetical protein
MISFLKLAAWAALFEFSHAFVTSKIPVIALHGSIAVRNIPNTRSPGARYPIVTHVFPSNSGGDEHDEALSRARNDARVDVRNLLTQRAIQSFMYLCESVRDPHSGKWIEDFLGTSNQLNYHGTGAGFMEEFGGTWDAPLLAMMKQEKDVVVVSAKRTGKGHRGWSKNNPYLEDRYVEFNIDIDPASLTSRILSVREQIAKEWVVDLGVLDQANRRIIESYMEIAKKEREKKDAELQTTPPKAFERTVDFSLDDQSYSTEGGSPFRKGNFDLLCNLCTQASVHRLLRQLKDGGKANEVSFDFLRDFYVNRVSDYFDGDQRYGRADDFLEELLLTAPSLFKASNGAASLTDPMGLAENIIAMRSEVVGEWKAIMEDVPQAHGAGIRKALLEKQMEAWGSGTPLGGESSSSSFE